MNLKSKFLFGVLMGTFVLSVQPAMAEIQKKILQ